MIVYYIGGPADLVKQNISEQPIPAELYFTMGEPLSATKPHAFPNSVLQITRSRYALEAIVPDPSGHTSGIAIYVWDRKYKEIE